jgi:hypothetical protein
MPVSRDGVVPFASITGLTPAIFRVLSIEKLAGGKQLDHAVVAVDLAAANKYVENLDLASLTVQSPSGPINLNGAEMSIQAEVNGLSQTLHWGSTTVYELAIPDQIALVCRLEQSHFGFPLGFQLVWDPTTRTYTRSDHEVAFNPDYKGAIFGNKRPPGEGNATSLAFIDPDSLQSSFAAVVQGVAYVEPNNLLRISESMNENWSLADAAAYLFQDCNSLQQFIQNPTLQQIKAILPDDRRIVKNHRLRLGCYLNEALDLLLDPYGYTWTVDHESPTSRRIRLIRNGLGRSRAIQLQAPGASLDNTRSNVKQFKLTYDESMAVNQVRAVGGFTAIEATFELMPAWGAAYDSTSLGNLYNGNFAWKNTPQYHRVWREWVLNEAGDYYRGWNTAFPKLAANPKLTQFFRDVYGADHPVIMPKRRKFMPMLTLGDDGQPFGPTGGCLVEWWNARKKGGAGWDPIDPRFPFFSCRLLENEAGIKFDGGSAPFPIRRDGVEARLRITATLVSDTRIVATAARRSSSVNKQTNEFVADVGARFHARLLHPQSVYYSEVTAGTKKADQTYGQVALQDFANVTRDAWDQAGCSGYATLEGLEHDYKIGDLVVGMQGREIQFGLNKGGADSRFLQVVGVYYEVQGQEMKLVLNDYREADAYVAGMLRKTKRLK